MAIEIDELTKLLTEETSLKKERAKLPKKESHNTKQVEKYIKESFISIGDNKVPAYIIYHHYYQYCKHFRVQPCGKEDFFRIFKKHFKQSRSRKERRYLINDAIIVNEETIEKAKKFKERSEKKQC
jgi:hypothetical protein